VDDMTINFPENTTYLLWVKSDYAGQIFFKQSLFQFVPKSKLPKKVSSFITKRAFQISSSYCEYSFFGNYKKPNFSRAGAFVTSTSRNTPAFRQQSNLHGKKATYTQKFLWEKQNGKNILWGEGFLINVKSMYTGIDIYISTDIFNQIDIGAGW
jgi:hypothetical protein